MSWDATVAALLGGAWRANAANPVPWQREWQIEQQYRRVGSLPRAQRISALPRVSAAPAATAPKAQAGFPQRIDLSLPWSSQSKMAPAYKSTQGDILGSAGEALGGAVWGKSSYLNLSNAIPWLVERPLVGVDEAAKQITSDDENIVSKGLDFLGGIVKGVAQPVAEAMDVPLNWIRDSLLGDRAKVYRALVTRTSISGMTSFAGEAAPLNSLLSTLSSAVDGDTRQKAEDSLRMLAQMIDLPDELKREIEANPSITDDQINKTLDRVGRQISYKGGPEGFVLNAGPALAVYGAEMLATGGAAGALKTAVQGMSMVGRATTIGNALRLGAWAGRGIYQVQKYALAAGLGYLGADVVADTALHYFGNEEGVAYLDHLNRSTLFSDDPAVQLVMSFTVDPIAAAKIAVKTGSIPLRYGGRIAVGQRGAQRFVKMFEDEPFLYSTLGKAYGVSPDVARNLIGPEGYESIGQAWDSVIGLSAKVLTSPGSPLRIVGAERWATEVSNRGATEAFLRANWKQVLDVVEKHPEQLARPLLDSWVNIRRQAGPFNPWVAVKVELGYSRATQMTEAARTAFDAVLGVPDILPPAAVEIARDYVDQLFTAGRATVADLNEFIYRFPGVVGSRKGPPTWTGLGAFAKATDNVDRAVFDDMIARAAQTYDDTFLHNPVRATMGRDPVLRPNSPMRNREWADALGTTEETVAAIGKAPSAAVRDLVSAFVREKVGLSADDVARLGNEELWSKASEYADKTTAPWVARGTEVEAVEKVISDLDHRSTELRYAAELPAAERAQRFLLGGVREQLAQVAQERARLMNLISDAIEPAVPFTQAVKYARPAGAAQRVLDRAQRIVDAQTRLATIASVKTAVDAVPAVGDLLASVKQIGGRWVWAADLRAAEGPVFDAAESIYRDWRYKWTAVSRSSAGAVRRHLTAAAQAFEQSPPLYRLGEMIDSPGFVRYLRTNAEKQAEISVGGAAAAPVRYADVAEMIEQAAKVTGKGIVSDIDAGMIEALGVGTREQFIERLGELRSTYDEALQGARPYDLGVTAAGKAPEWAMAEANVAARQLWRDPLGDVERTLARAEIVRALSSADTFDSAAALIEKDPELLAKAADLAGEVPVADFLRAPGNREALRSLVPDEPGVIPGVPAAQTDLDDAILRGDPAALDQFRTQLEDLRGRIAEPVHNVSPEAADEIIRKGRPSRNLVRAANEAGLNLQDGLPADAWVGREVAGRAASAILWGRFDAPPRTIASVVSVLREIENGNAANAGLGTELAAEVQRAANQVIGREVAHARRAAFDKGFLGMGHGLDPATWTQDAYEEVRSLFGKENVPGVLGFDEGGNIAYTLKKRPKDALVVEMSTVPGLVEELMSGRFLPFEGRLGLAQLRQQFNAIFGPKHNQAIFFEASQRFSKALLERYGVPLGVSEAIWKGWSEASRESHELLRKKGAGGAVSYIASGQALYASARNIPNTRLEKIAQDILERKFPDYQPGLEVAIGEQFRLATSDVRRGLSHLPLGDGLQRMYGKFAHNDWVTFLYYQFRFGLDLRFRAMEGLEGPALYAGRAGLRSGAREGMFGMDRQAIAKVADDAMLNTGLPFAITRDGWVYKTLLKEQPDSLRALVVEDPALFQKAVYQIVERDPQMADMLKVMGETPNSYLRVMNDYWGKLMRSADPRAVIDGEIMAELAKSPELAECLSRIGEANKSLLDDIRGTFYGNPNRSQVERWLNHYLLYWPISYQIKATKWMLRIMYDRIGGLKTNALGAYALDQMAKEHMRLLSEDPDYAQFFADHSTLLFVAQMLIPITPTQVGISLSPPLRDLFFGYTKQVLDIGPIYTLSTLLPRMAGELYADLKDVPGMETLYRMAAGRNPPKEKPKESELWQPDYLRWGQ